MKFRLMVRYFWFIWVDRGLFSTYDEAIAAAPANRAARVDGLILDQRPSDVPPAIKG